METHISTTPFGRRPMSLAMLAAQAEARNIPEGKSANKWKVYRDLCEGKDVIGVGDRALAVLNALLSCYPDDELSEETGLVVFPSNTQLSLRAHGMPSSTLRRHLAVLVERGLVARKDSPNGKRYARKDKAGELKDAFGFSLAPLLARADEFAAAADQVRADNRALRLMRERITLHRRDIHKLIEMAIEERMAGDWAGLWCRFRMIVDAIPRRASLADLEAIVAELAALHEEVDMLLEKHMNSMNPSANEYQSERQQSNSNTKPQIEFEPASEKSGATVEPRPRNAEPPKTYPLGLVLKACPDIVDYAQQGISNWRDLMATAALVRTMLGVSPSAYAEALDALGQENTAVVIACVLQRAQHINSPGGYLRVLTEKARAGQFSVGPMLMALLNTQGTSPSARTG
nr:plasmid replication protein RepC [Nitrosomonas nitrosa]